MDRLSSLATLANLLQADTDTVTITLDNQKSRQRGAVLRHQALPNKPLCLCKVAA